MKKRLILVGGLKMARLKSQQQKCPKCGSDEAFCQIASVRRISFGICFIYVLFCVRCNEVVNTRKAFSLCGEGIKPRGLSCPFCHEGRKRHRIHNERKWTRRRKSWKISWKKNRKSAVGGEAWTCTS